MINLSKYRPASDLVTTVTAKLLYLIMLDIVGEDGCVVISQKKIGETLGLNRSTIGHNLRRLERCGVIRIYATYSQYGGQMPNKYELRKDFQV